MFTTRYSMKITEVYISLQPLLRKKNHHQNSNTNPGHPRKKQVCQLLNIKETNLFSFKFISKHCDGCHLVWFLPSALNVRMAELVWQRIRKAEQFSFENVYFCSYIRQISMVWLIASCRELADKNIEHSQCR